ncbi:MAG: DUF4091 domain-containing protein [Candidatus Sericytochromatia bacterium]
MEKELKLFSFEENESIKYAGDIKSFKYSTKFFIKGKNSAELIFKNFSQKGQKQESLELKIDNNNWSEFKYLNLSVYNPEEDNLWLGIKLTDNTGKSDIVTEHCIYNKTTNTLINLNEYKVDLRNIQEISFFIIRPQIFKYNDFHDVKIYLDDIKLSNEKLSIEDIKVSKNFFNSRLLVESKSNILSDWELKVYDDKNKLVNNQIFKNSIDPKWILNIKDEKKYKLVIESKKDDEIISKEQIIQIQEDDKKVFFGVESQSKRVDFYNPEFIQKNLSFNILKGERQSFQIPFMANYDGELKFSGLNKINHKIYKIGAVQGFQPKYLFNTDNEGYIFDVLDEINDKSIKFKKGELNCLYIELFNNTETKYFNDNLSLDFGIEKKEIDLKINLSDLELNKSLSPKNAISTYPNFISQFYPNQVFEKTNEIYKLIGEEYILPNNLYRGDIPTIEEINNIIAINPNTFTNLRFFATEPNLDKVILDLKEPINYIRKNNLTDNFFFFVFDEAREDVFSEMKRVTDRLKLEFPDIKLISTAKLFLKPELKKQLQIDIWIPSIKDFYTNDLIDYSWFYIFIANRPPYTNWYLNSDLIESRLIWWIAYKYNLSGFLYYTLNRWVNNKDLIDTNDFPNLSWNPQSFEDANGDGEMIYPSKDKILSSLRLKNFGKGIEDYILLKMLEKKYGRDFVLKQIEPIIKNSKYYSKNIKDLEKVRNMLEKM